MRIGSSTLELRVESTSSARDARCGLRCVSHRRVGPLSSLTDRVAAVSHRHWTESRCVHRLDRAALVGSSRAPPLLAGRLAWSCGRTGRRLSTPDKGRLDWSRPLVAHWAMPSRPTDTLSLCLCRSRPRRPRLRGCVATARSFVSPRSPTTATRHGQHLLDRRRLCQPTDVSRRHRQGQLGLRQDQGWCAPFQRHRADRAQIAVRRGARLG